MCKEMDLLFSVANPVFFRISAIVTTVVIAATISGDVSKSKKALAIDK